MSKQIYSSINTGKSVYDGGIDIGSLNNVVIDNITVNETLVYNGSNFVNGNVINDTTASSTTTFSSNKIDSLISAVDLPTLPSVSINTPTSNEILQYNGTKWANNNGYFYRSIIDYTSSSPLSAALDTFYLNRSGATINVTYPTVGSKIGMYADQLHGGSLTFDKGVYSNTTYYPPNVTVNCLTPGSTIEFICTYDMVDFHWFILSMDGEWSFNGTTESNVKSIGYIKDVSLATPTSGQLLSFNGTEWINENTDGYIYEDTYSSSITAQSYYFYQVHFGTTITAPNSPANGFKFGVRCGINTTTINFSNSVYSNQTGYNGSCTVVNNGDNGVIEFVYFSSQPAWSVVSISGNFYFNGTQTSSPRSFSEIVGVALASSSSGQFLSFNGTDWTNHTLSYSDLPALTQNSVLFAGAGGVISQNNTGFYWDNTNLTLDINSGNTTLPATGGYSLKCTGGIAILNGVNDYDRFISALDNAMTVGSQRNIAFGQSASTNNEAELIFTYAGPGSTSNTFGLGLYGAELITMTQNSVNFNAQGNFFQNAKFFSGVYDNNNYLGAAGQVLSSTGTGVQWINAGGTGTSTLTGLSDVSITTPVNNQVLTYDSSTSKWINSPISNIWNFNSAGPVSSTNYIGANSAGATLENFEIIVPFKVI